MFRIQNNNTFAAFNQIADQAFGQVRFTLAGVAEDQNVGIGMCAVTFIKISNDIRTVSITANRESMRIRFAGIGIRIQVSS